MPRFPAVPKHPGPVLCPSVGLWCRVQLIGYLPEHRARRSVRSNRPNSARLGERGLVPKRNEIVGERAYETVIAVGVLRVPEHRM